MDNGLPVIWWLWWFIASFVVYGVLILWFWRVSRHETNTVPQQQDNVEPTA